MKKITLLFFLMAFVVSYGQKSTQKEAAQTTSSSGISAGADASQMLISGKAGQYNQSATQIYEEPNKKSVQNTRVANQQETAVESLPLSPVIGNKNSISYPGSFEINAETTVTDSPNLPIPDNNPGGVTTTITVTEDEVMTDVNIHFLANHTWVGDLIIEITSPEGTTVRIVDRPGYEGTGFGCNNNGPDVTLDDDGATAIETGCSGDTNTIMTGTFSPNNPLSAFNGESSLGTWTLFVSDNAAGDTGNIQTWGITYSYSGGGGGNCSLTVAGQMGISSTPVGYFVEAGSQLGRLFRDGVATTCPNKPYPGNFNPATTYNWTSVRFYNSSAGNVCITVIADVDSGALPCLTNGHGMVYQEPGGGSTSSYNPADIGENFVGDVGSSLSQPFSVEVEPGWFEVVFSNTSAQDNCDFGFTIDDGGTGFIQCDESGGGGTNPCSFTNPSNAFENGTPNSLWVTANDLLVTADETFSLEQIVVNIMTAPGSTILFADLTYYDNSGSNLPGAQIGSQTNVIPTSQTIIGSAFGLDVREVVLDITPFDFNAGPSDTTFWIQIHTPNSVGTATYWDATTATIVGNPAAGFDGVAWSFPPGWAGLDGVYEFIGECSGSGGGGDCSTPVVDVDQPSENTCMANFSQGGLAQSFIPGMPVSAGAGIKLISASNGLNVDLSLWDGLPNGGGTMLASGTTITSGDVWVDVFWDTPADVTIGDTYYIVIEGDFANPCIAGDTNNPYPDGMVFANNYGSFPTFDYTFRTYGCEGGGSGGDCEVANPTNPGGVDNGYNIAVDAGFGVATDVVIPADENFIIDHVVINVLSNAGVGTVDINYYSDNAGLPGTVVGSEVGIVPLSTDIIGTAFGFNIHEVIMDVTPFEFTGQAGMPTTYWLQPITGTGSVFWEVSYASVVESQVARLTTGVWALDTVNFAEAVYFYSGECTGGGNPGGECDEENFTSIYENGYTSSTDQAQRIATDITVPVGFDLTLNNIKSMFWVNAGETLNNFEVIIYGDNFGLPNTGDVIDTQTLAPTDVTFVTNSLGFDVYEFDLPIAPVSLAGDAANVMTYWVQLTATVSSGSGYWDSSSSSIVGYPAVFSADGGATWGEIAGWDQIYIFESDCEELGGNPGDCVESVAQVGATEDGLNCAINAAFGASNDITVPADNSFVLNQITANILSNGDITLVNVLYYNDNAGLPGTQLDSEMGISTFVSDNIVGSAFGFDIHEIVFDVTPYTFNGEMGNDVTYWIELEVDNTAAAGGIYWEVTTDDMIGNPIALFDFGVWQYFDPTYEGVYTWTGDCEPVVSTEEDTIVGFTFYPNPAVDVIYLQADTTIDTVEIYNLLGQKVISQTIGSNTSQVDVSGLSTGTYLMNVSSEGIMSTHKVVKK